MRGVNYICSALYFRAWIVIPCAALFIFMRGTRGASGSVLNRKPKQIEHFYRFGAALSIFVRGLSSLVQSSLFSCVVLGVQVVLS